MEVQTTPASQARWRRRKDARPAEIIAAGLACFAERGYAATRCDDVARRAGLTKGTLYLYFPSKEELFKAVVRQTVVANIAASEAIEEESVDPAPVLLEKLVSRLSATIETPTSAIPKIIIAESGNFPDIARFYLDEVIERGLALFTRVLKAGIARGEFAPADVVSTAYCIVSPLLMGMMWRHSFERHAGQPIDAAALCRAHLRILSHGLRPAAAAREAKRRQKKKVAP
jgi:AcrR family transcriptional regulator